MGKNYIESSLKRYLKRKVKITFALVISFLITGTVLYAGEKEKGTVKREKAQKEYVIDEELLRNILREISLGNIHIIEKGDEPYSGTQEINNGQIGVNNGLIEFDRDNGQKINNGLGINNGIILISRDFGQNIQNGGLGINNSIILGNLSSGQNINNSLGINNGIVINERERGQDINSSGLGINNGTISNGTNYGQFISGLGINNGIISNGGNFGQNIQNDGLGINNGVIANGGNWGQYVNSSLGINNGIIINNTAYQESGGRFYKNGIALKRDKDNKLVFNNHNLGNDNVNILEKNELTGNFSSLNLFKKVTGQTSDGKEFESYNLFINNLGIKVNDNNTPNNTSDDIFEEDTNAKNSQLVIDTDLSENFANTHITTAVTNGSFDNTNGAVVKIAENMGNFSMDKSTIIGYFEQDGTFADMTGAENITLADSVISAFGKDENINVTAVKFGAGTKVTLNNSTVNGKMDFSAGGNNILNLNAVYNGMEKEKYADGTQFMTSVSDVSFDTGNDTINIEIQKGTGDETNKTGKGFVSLGKVNFGGGDDTLSFSFEDYKSGHFTISGEKEIGADGKITKHHGIDFGAGDNDRIKFSDVLDMEKYTELNGTTVTEGGTAVGKNLVMLNNLLNNESMPIENLEILELADGGGNVFYFEGKDKDGKTIKFDFNGKVLGGKGEDTFVTALDNLASYNFNGGEGTDYIQIIEQYDESKIVSVAGKNIEGLKLGNFENNVNIDNLADKNINFTHFKGGNLEDTFKISTENLPNITIDGGYDEQGNPYKDNDTLQLTKGVNNLVNENLFDNVSNIETLQLADNVTNILNIDNLKFTEINGGNKVDDFTIRSADKLGITINGGAGNDHLTLGTSINTAKDLKNISGIETIVFWSSNNIFNFNQYKDINNLTLLEFMSNSNKVTINNLDKKNINFNGGGGNTGDEANKVFVADNQSIFKHKISGADDIFLYGNSENDWTFDNTAKITGENVSVNVDDNGTIGFIIGKSSGNAVLGKGGVNPFAETGNYTINGNIKVTFDETVRFTSLSDKLTGTGNISLGENYNIIVPEFMKYDRKNKEFSIKSAEELKSAGLKDYAFGNYEYAILNYNKAGYEGITSMLNNNNLTDISKALNKGIEQKDFYFYSDDREIKDKITLGNINIETSKDNQVTGENLNTDIKFTNVTGGTANINFAQGTTNSVSFLDGVNISKIDGSSSNAGFTLNLDGINFSKSQDAKDNTEVVMSDYADTLNINSKLEGIGINTGDGEDIVNISSYVKNITLNTGAGNDTVNILSSIKGIFDGNEGTNILNIGKEIKTLSDENSQDEIVLNGEIKNFQDINLNQNTKLESSLKISQNNQSEKINLNLNGNSLFVDVDYTKKADDKVIGHALYDNGIKVDNESGKVMIDTAKANNGTIISLGTAGNKTEFASTDKEHLLESGSSNHHIEMIDGDIVVKVNEHIMGDSETGAIEYAHLDKIYQSIVSADKIKEMAETTTLSDKTKDEAVKAQLEFYGKIYHSTPYAYSNDVSKKSADLITESIMNLKVMPEYKHWVFGGSIAGQEADSASNFYGSNYYTGIDIGKNEVSADTNIYGAYAFGKYGIGVNQSVGFAIAGTRSDTDISGNSKIEGDGIYVSAFAEQEINNLKFLAGISYQHSFYDSTRNVSNDYQRMSVDKKYEDDLVSIFAGGKYSYHLGNNFFAEPNVKLSVTHIMQDSIDEGDNGGLTIETDKKDFTFVEGEVGIDLVKKINLSKGTLNLRAGTSLVYLLDGYQEEYLTGRITGSSKSFEMISPEDDRTKVKFTVGTEYEMTNGMFMNLHGNYTTSSHTEDYAVSFGAGYKF